jgi:hypothetical protein
MLSSKDCIVAIATVHLLQIRYADLGWCKLWVESNTHVIKIANTLLGRVTIQSMSGSITLDIGQTPVAVESIAPIDKSRKVARLRSWTYERLARIPGTQMSETYCTVGVAPRIIHRESFN